MMNFSFCYPSYGELHFIPGLPASYAGPILRESHQEYFLNQFGLVVKQDVNFEEFSFVLFFFHFRRRLKLNFSMHNGMQSLLAYRSDTYLKLLHKNLHLKEQQFCLFNGQCEKGKLLLKDKPSVLLYANYHEGFLQQLAPAFVEHPLLTGEPLVEVKAANSAIRDTVHRILYAEYEPSRLPFYFKNKISEYLFLLLDETAKPNNAPIMAADWEKESLFKVRTLILADILKHYHINELAKKVKMNPFRLKVLFKAEFGVGPFEFLLNARLEKAKELMEAGMPMKQAAPLAGYRTTSFITAFKRRFGYSPGKIRRKG